MIQAGLVRGLFWRYLMDMQQTERQNDRLMDAVARLYRLCLACLCILASGSVAVAGEWREEQVSNGGLHGTLTWPVQQTPPLATVLMIAGSGPVDRDGNLPGMAANNLRMLAHDLAGAGIASLRTDKRGIGASGKVDERILRFGTYVDDTLAWLEFLKQREESTGPIWIAGHSEGALVATMAAQRGDVAGLVLLAGAGRKVGMLVDSQLVAAGVRADVLAASRRVTSALEAGRMTDDVPAGLEALYRRDIQAYLISWFSLDPARELASVHLPVLIIQGDRDLQIGVGDARLLANALPSATLRIMTGMNHILKDAPEDHAGNIAIYNRPDLPLSPGLLETITGFIRQQAVP